MENNLTILVCCPRSRDGLSGRGRLPQLLVSQLDLIRLAARTPGEHRLLLQDEDLAPISPVPRPDLALLLVSTANAKRAWSLADELRGGGIPTVLAGPYVQAHPDGAARHADAVLAGPADLLWTRAVADFLAGRLARQYAGRLQTDRVGLPATNAPRTVA